MATISVQNSGERLDAFLASEISDFSRAQIKQAIEAGEVTVNGLVCTKAGRKLAMGDVVAWDVPEVQENAGIPEPEDNIAFRVVYEDEHIVVIDKPSGLVVHPGAGNLHGTLINGLLKLYPEIAEVGEPERPGIVHRIDGGTSGLLVVARSQAAYEALVRMFAAHEVHRQYWAICYGPKLPDCGRFDTPYGRHPTQRVKYSSRFDAPKRAVTNYRVAARNPAGYILVTCLLETGRTHQVRVHLSDHNAPILGDPLYAPEKLAKHKAIDRLALHAQRLEFDHPVTGAHCAFEAPFPEDFLKAMTLLGLK
ncbi:MAG: RluA family pseudouridine synthase [Proteobacteria bacterium]|nr:RluA family pseudouridine synthase [Pseudomonadota bacterium]